MKGPHVSLYYGTARNNWEGFDPSKKEWVDSNGLRRKLPENYFKKGGIRFGRMNTTKEFDKIPYLELDKSKSSNVPILVSIDDVVLKIPVQIVWDHMGDPKRQQFEGNPNLNYISDTGAKKLLRDAKSSNPNQKNVIDQINQKYFGQQLGGRIQQTARAAEYYVAAELNRKGAYAVTFSGNMPKIDILASSANQDRTVQIQVKARKAGTWQCSVKDGKQCNKKVDDNCFWVFVDLSQEKNPPDYYITPDWWIRNNIYETNNSYLKKRFGERAVTLDSLHHAIDENRLEQWKNKWDILGIGII